MTRSGSLPAEQMGRALETELSPQGGGATPAIALTAHARLEDRTRALRAGFTNHVAKPLDPPELLTVIGAASERRRPTTAP